MMDGIRRILPYFYAFAGIVLVWQAVVLISGAHVAILPPPLLAAQTFVELIVSGELFVHISASLGRVVAAWRQTGRPDRQAARGRLLRACRRRGDWRSRRRGRRRRLLRQASCLREYHRRTRHSRDAGGKRPVELGPQA